MWFLKGDVHPLTELSLSLRQDMLEMVRSAGAGHIGGALSAIDTIISTYESGLFNFDHDHFILSAGHLCLAHYVVLAHRNPKLKSRLATFSEFGSIFQAHETIEVPGVEYSSGSLGQGLSFSCGLALGDKGHTTICVTTDGEHNEGQVWEAAMFGSKFHLGNLINIVICDGIQIDGRTSDIMPQGDIVAKYLRFGWTVTTVDGHNFYALERALRKSLNSTVYPAVIIANCTFGRGVAHMENNPEFHHIKNFGQEEYQKAINALDKQFSNLQVPNKLQTPISK